MTIRLKSDDDSTFSRMIRYFSVEGNLVNASELNEFWESLNETERAEYRSLAFIFMDGWE